jgi:hypothetical protein
MSQRAALLISTALTVLTMIGGLALAARLIEMDAAEVPADTPAPVSDAVTTESEYEHEYVERLEAANRALELSQQQIAELTTRIQALEVKNTTLQEREQVYQERLAEARARLEGQGQAALAAAPPPDATAAPPPPSSPEEAAVQAPVVAVEVPDAASAVGPDADGVTAAAALPEPPVVVHADAQAPPVRVHSAASLAEPVAGPAQVAPVRAPATSGNAPQPRPAPAPSVASASARPPTPTPGSTRSAVAPERPARASAPSIVTVATQAVNILQMVTEYRGAGVRSLLPPRNNDGGRGKRGGRD